MCDTQSSEQNICLYDRRICFVNSTDMKLESNGMFLHNYNILKTITAFKSNAFWTRAMKSSLNRIAHAPKMKTVNIYSLSCCCKPLPIS